MNIDKTTIRKKIIEKRDSLSKEEISKKSMAITESLLGTSEYSEAKNVLIYASMKSEVITDGIIEDALSKGKNVFCPKVTDKEKRQMTFVKIEDQDDFEKGYFGIREPVITDDSIICKDSGYNSLVIMPGVVFDRSRNRIGYGGGFYDTFLAANSKVSKIALAFDCQLYEGAENGDSAEFPHELLDEHDVKPDKIITESEII